MLEFIEVNPKSRAKSSIIWLHGLGADGSDFVNIIPELNLPDDAAIRFIFPHAPMRSITWANNMPMRAWFNVIRLDRSVEDKDGIRASQTLIDELINQEILRSIPSQNIILAGFSQGGAMALQCGLRYKEKLGGILVLSAWLPLASTLEKEKSSLNQSTPILMQHGTFDDLLPLSWATESRDFLSKLNYNVILDSYPMQHQVCQEEIGVIGKWIKQLVVS